MLAPRWSAAPSIAWPSASPRAAPPPLHRRRRIALDAERVVENHTEPSHRRGNAVAGGALGVVPGGDVIGRGNFAFEQYPTHHVLRRAVILLGSGAIEFQRAGVILFDAFAFEIKRGAVALADAVAGSGGEREPLRCEFRVALDAEPFGEAGADIVLRPRHARLRQRPPDFEGAGVIA